MRTLIRYSLQDLAAHWKLSLAMTLLIGASILFFLVISGYRLTLGREYAALPDVNLIVQESNTLGELYGSRIQAQVVEQLYALGVSQAIPEFHDTVGTSVDDMLMLRGVDPERYQTLDRLTLLSGQALQPGDPPRTAMLGRRLAEKLGVSAGQVALIRGRQFNVCGVFHTGTYADNEAWVSIADAQDLLGWGSDVSLYIIPDEGILQPGQSLAGGLSVARRGQGAYISVSQKDPLLSAMDIVIQALAVAAVLALTNTLIRLAWLRRRELAILRCTGFQSGALAVYLFSQALTVTLGGALLGVAGTMIVFVFLRADLAGMSFEPRLDAGLVLITLGLTLLLSLLGIVLPVAWIRRLMPGDLLRDTS